MKRFLLVLAISVVQFGCVREFHQVAQRKLVFVFFDNGETKALLPSINYLKSRQVPYSIVAVGPARALVENEPGFVNLQNECDVSESFNSKWPKDLDAPEHQIDRILDCLKPHVVVTGLFSKLQEQIAVAMKGRNRSVWGYYDSFSPNSISVVSRPLLNALEKLMVPSRSLKLAFEKRISAKFIEVVGQPTLEEWRSFASEVDARKVLRKLEVTKTFPVVLYAGGYGEDYEAAFRSFVQNSSDLKDCIILVSLHPTATGDLEQKLINELNAGHIRIIPKSVTTKEAAVIADIVVTHRSTVGVQAVFLAKPVIYLDTKAGAYSDVAIENNWATQIFTGEEFSPLVRTKLREKTFNNGKDIYTVFGIPKDSARLIGRKLEAKLLD